MDNCDLVIQFTKAYRKLTHLHNNEVKGLIDRDRRSQQELDSLKEDGIYVPLVAEIENLFLLEAVIKLLAEDRHKNQTQIDEIVTKTKERVFLFLEKELENQVVLFLSQERQNQVNTILSKKAKTLEESKEQLAQISQIDLDTPYQKINDVLKQIIQEKECEKALEIINNKGLLPDSGLTNVLDGKKTTILMPFLALLRRTQKKE